MKSVQFADGKLSFDPSSSAYQIARLYEAVLDRKPDSLGLSFWTEKLSHGTALSEIATSFTESSEFKSEYGLLSDEQFVALLYNNVLDRAPDAGGLSAWVTSLNAGSNRSSVVLGFSESMEFQQKVSSETREGIWVPDAEATTIARLYYAALDRAPDAEGLKSWTNALETSASLEKIVGGFMQSEEFQTRYGKLDDGMFVDVLYDNVLDRVADVSGKGVWTYALSQGMSREQVVLGFSESLEFQIKMQPATDHGIIYV